MVSQAKTTSSKSQLSVQNHAIATRQWDTASSFRPETLLQPYPAAYPNSQTVTVQQKLEELRLLLGKFSSPQNTHTILELAKYNSRAIPERKIRAALNAR